MQTRWRPMGRKFVHLNVYEPGHTWQIDFMGPLPEDENKNKYVVVFVDAFTRHAELFII
jgi:hypothetical protein